MKNSELQMPLSLFRGVNPVLLVVVLAFATLLASAQQGTRIPMDITLVLQGYELPKKDAAAIMQGTGVLLDPAMLLQQLAKARAKIVKLGTLKTNNGERAVVREKSFELEMDPISGVDSRFIDLNLAFSRTERNVGAPPQITTSVTVSDGSVAFLGTVEGPKKDSVELVFLRATLSRSAP